MARGYVAGGGTGQRWERTHTPQAQDGLCWPEAVPPGFLSSENPGFPPLAVRRPEPVSGRRGPSTLPCPPSPKCGDTFWVTSGTWCPDLASESFLSAASFSFQESFGSFIYRMRLLSYRC